MRAVRLLESAFPATPVRMKTQTTTKPLASLALATALAAGAVLLAAAEQPGSSLLDPLKGSPPDIKLKLPAFKAQPTDRPQTLAQVKPVLGVPTLVLDGKPYGPMIYTRCAGTLDQLAEMGFMEKISH